jgi:hypothetical protein
MIKDELIVICDGGSTEGSCRGDGNSIDNS